jgi:hypothetical protein
MDKHYIKSERFIHDGLLVRCGRVMKKSYDQWHQGLRFSIAIFWPASAVMSDSGDLIDSASFLPLPEERDQWLKQIVGATTRMKAYALLVVELNDKEVFARFESQHGARSWRSLPERHGDIRVLGTEVIHDDAEHVGVLWRKDTSRGQSS